MIEPKSRKLQIAPTHSASAVTMRPGSKKEIKVEFTPKEAKVVIQTAVFTIREGEQNH